MKKLMEKYNSLPKEKQEKIDKIVMPIITAYCWTVVITLQVLVTIITGIAGAMLDYDYPVSGFILGAIVGMAISGYVISKNEWL